MFAAQEVPYSQTHAFTKIVLDYLDGSEPLRSFYTHPPTPEGLLQALELKKTHSIDRSLLAGVFREQYGRLKCTDAVSANIEALLSPSTFTICTAHQPNLFTGPLYFIYKILHAIRLAQTLSA